jgi:hypothetical protein
MITNYPIDSRHKPIVRGDPLAITIRLRHKLPDDSTEPIDITGTFWRSHVRESADKPLLARFLCTIIDGPGGVLSMAMSSIDTAELFDGVRWDLEQVSDGNDDDGTLSLGTWWIVQHATVVKDLSHSDG